MAKDDSSVFWASLFEQKKSLKKLIEESRADGDFYIFLIVSTFIATLGLVMDSAIIVIGGMLVAPLLFPILSLAMGITTSNIDSINRSFVIILKATSLVLFVSILTSFLFRGEDVINGTLLVIDPTLILFLVSFAAGIAAAYAWVKQNLSAALPGIAVSVSLIPPLAAVGVGITYANGSVVFGSLTVFIINLLGITVSALIIFSLFGFSRLQREEEKLIQQEAIEDLSHVKNKLAATKEKLEHVTEEIKEKGREDIKQENQS
tara:strand:- start:2169 stop:2954 length:786 start_codon:yes stop_codon:yes gene_type:complete